MIDLKKSKIKEFVRIVQFATEITKKAMENGDNFDDAWINSGSDEEVCQRCERLIKEIVRSRV